MGQFVLWHVRSVVGCVRACLRLWDLWAMCTSRFYPWRVLVILQSNQSEMNGILRYSHSMFCDWGSRVQFWGHLISVMPSSGYPLRYSVWSNSLSCLLNVVWVEHFCCIRFLSLWMKLIFEFLGRVDWSCTNSGFFAGFLLYSKELSPEVFHLKWILRSVYSKLKIFVWRPMDQGTNMLAVKYQ